MPLGSALAEAGQTVFQAASFLLVRDSGAACTGAAAFSFAFGIDFQF
jgi:hypothetical protein